MVSSSMQRRPLPPRLFTPLTMGRLTPPFQRLPHFQAGIAVIALGSLASARMMAAENAWNSDGWELTDRTDDSALVARCLDGDREAFDQLIDRFSSMAYSLAYRHLGDREEAMDLTQDVFLQVYRKLSSFRGHSSLKTWIHRIVVNMAYNKRKHWRVRKRHLTRSLDAPVAARDGDQDGATLKDLVPDDSTSPAEQTEKLDREQRLQLMLTSLPPLHRSILILRDMQELSYDEIAALLGIPSGTVKSRLSRARNELRQQLKREEWI